MEEEIQWIYKNDSWELIPPLRHKNNIKIKWMYKLKHNIDGNIAKCKSQMGGKGYIKK